MWLDTYSYEELQKMVNYIEVHEEVEITRDVNNKSISQYNKAILDTLLNGTETMNKEEAETWGNKLYNGLNKLVNSNTLDYFQIKIEKETKIPSLYISNTLRKTTSKSKYNYTYKIPITEIVERLTLAIAELCPIKINGVIYIDHNLTHTCIKKCIPMVGVAYKDGLSIPSSLWELLDVLNKLNDNFYSLGLLLSNPPKLEYKG